MEGEINACVGWEWDLDAKKLWQQVQTWNERSFYISQLF